MANSGEIARRYRRAKRWRDRRAKLSEMIDTVLTAAAHKLHMCGQGKHHNWSVLFAQLWFTDCPCCLFYRGVTLGAVVGIAAATVAQLFI